MKLQRDKYAQMFADYVAEGLRRTNMRRSQLAEAAKVSRQTIGQIVNRTPHRLTGKLTLPERETVDAIARAFGDPIALARAAAGYDPGEETQAPDEAQILAYFRALPDEQRQDALALLRALHDRHAGQHKPGDKIRIERVIGKPQTG